MSQEDLDVAKISWDHSADVVVAGTGGAGLPACVMARDVGATVIAIDENHDVGGHAMVSGGRIPLGGGTSFQKKYGIEDSVEQVFLDHTNHLVPQARYSDRELIRVWAEENVPTFEFLVENGVQFFENAPVVASDGTVPRLAISRPYSDDIKETINHRNGSGLIRHLERNARAKGVVFLLRHKLAEIVRERPTSGRVLGIKAVSEGRDVYIRAKQGVVIATGGHTSNVEFRRMFDPRLTEEYQTAGEPWSKQNGDGELLAMAIGASLWATANQSTEAGRAVTKTRHIGCRYGYDNLRWLPESPMFHLAGASGLTVKDWQNVILVNRMGRRFWNEVDETYAFVNAALGVNGSKSNGGGPVWAIFDAAAAKREKWNPVPPNVDLNGWFFSAATIAELAQKIVNPYQKDPIPPRALVDAVERYHSYVDMGKDPEFGKPAPQFKFETPPFYAAWSTPILHDTMTGLRINTKCQVLDMKGAVIPGLYCAGESAGGFALHGLPRCCVFGRIAGREAALAKPTD